MNESGETPKENLPDLKKMKARIEFIGDFEDVKKVKELLKQLQTK